MKRNIFISIFILFAFIIECSAQPSYFIKNIVKLNSKNREMISAIRLETNHDREPIISDLVYEVASNAYETTYRPIGASPGWSPEMQKSMEKINQIAIKETLEHDFPDDTKLHEIFSKLDADNDNISILTEKIPQWPRNTDGKETLLEIKIYHILSILPSTYAAKTYIVVEATLFPSKGSPIYKKRVSFAELIFENNLTSEEKYKKYIENSLKSAIRIFWSDISRGKKKKQS
jgi:hypothetical protein